MSKTKNNHEHLNDDVENIKSLSVELKDTLEETGKDGKVYAKEKFNEKLKKIEAKLNVLKENLGELKESSVHYLKDNPLKAIFAAVITGFGIAKFL